MATDRRDLARPEVASGTGSSADPGTTQRKLRPHRLLVPAATLAVVVGATGAVLASTSSAAQTAVASGAVSDSILDDSIQGGSVQRQAESLGDLQPVAFAQARSLSAASQADSVLQRTTVAAAAKTTTKTTTKATAKTAAAPKAAVPGKTPASAKTLAKKQVSARGWSSAQYKCLVKLWEKESNWKYTARNRSSGAYGIPQALPARKMASAGKDWRTNPATQIEWGLKYIADRHDTPCGAWGHSQRRGWY